MEKDLYNKAIEYVQCSYCNEDDEEFLLLGNVAELIELLTGIAVKEETLAKYRKSK